MVAGIDNVDAQSGNDMNFKVFSDSIVSVRISATSDVRGTLSRVAYEGEATPKNKSAMIGKVAFTGTTSTGTSLVAHIVCELQNKYT